MELFTFTEENGEREREERMEGKNVHFGPMSKRERKSEGEKRPY